MKWCLAERTLLRIHAGDATVAQRQHLRLCADCTERYDALVDDLMVLNCIMEAPPPARAVHASAFRRGWAPLTAAAVALVGVFIVTTWVRQPAPLQVAARTAAVSAFAADVSAALFANGDAATTVALATNDAPYLQAALDAGALCTRDRYFNGECDDQLSALLYESD